MQVSLTKWQKLIVEQLGKTYEMLPIGVHKRNESIIKLQLITGGYFTAGAQI